MTMKKTDLYKNLAKQIDRRQKAALTPSRFGAGAQEATGGKRDKAEAPAKPVTISCRLPADLVARLRERAMDTEGGISAVVAAAVAAWLAEADGSEAT
jgi:hypothetical protein